ncbi:MAG: hypothetical protein NZ518_01950, partial [Dehalococcoidia bacterium]|nr:hypothetical protein [Dehalococcoidia bacterium]
RSRGLGVVITGTESERCLVDETRAATGGVAVVGAALPTVAAVLAQAAVVVGPDSGVLHIASAVGAPTVRLYGPVDHRAFGPYADDASEVVVSTMPCVPCNRLDYTAAELAAHPCVRDLAPAAVLAALERVTAGRS